MNSKLKECQAYIASWYVDGYVVTVRMDTTSDMDELCIQHAVVELLRDFIDHPIPEAFKENSQQLFEWVDFGFRRAMQGLDFGFTPQQEDQVKNLAFNYYIEGVGKVLGEPTLQHRIYRCNRMLLPKEVPII